MTPKLNSNHKKEFEEKGFFVIEDVLGSSEAKEVRKEVMKLVMLEKNASDNLKAILDLDHGIMPGAKNPAPKS